jgi:ribosomal protein S18 acetylase RimI-like enzyme
MSDMTNFSIRVMTSADLDFALDLTTIEEWGNSSADFPRLLALEPEGCFVGVYDGRRVGMITTTTYGSYAFLGSLIVHREYRQRGYGRRLLEHAVEYLKSSAITTMELDGVLAAVPLYRRLGFQDKYTSLRFRGAGSSLSANPGQYSAQILPDILDLDRKLTGLDRERVLTRLLTEFAGSSYVHVGAGVEAYAIVRKRNELNLFCGPIVATTPDFASELFQRVLGLYAGKLITVGVSALNREMVDILYSYGFENLTPSLRMYLGERIDYERHVFAIVSPEKG